MPTPPPFLFILSFLHARMDWALLLLLLPGAQQVLGIETLIYTTLDVDKACLQAVLAVLRRRQAPAMLSAKTNTFSSGATSDLGCSINASLAEACLPPTESLMQLATNDARPSPDSPKRFPGASPVYPK